MLRGDSPEEKNLRKYAETISAALKKSTLQDNIICYRGLDVNPLANVAPGKIVNLKQFTSTSVIDTKAFDAKVNMIFYAPAGTKGAAYIEPLSKFESQRELLFDKDCWFRVLSNKDNKVELEVL